MQWIALGSLFILGYWAIAYKATPLQRRRLAQNFFTVVVIVALLGVAYELMTTGTLGSPGIESRE